MASLPERAKVVIVGAGIVGNSMAYHLAKLGWRDIVLLEKGTLPNPGGSTGHASNFIFLTDHNKEMAAFTLDSALQYRELGVYHECGGIEVARTPERMEELKRRMASSKSWGVDGVRLLTPAEVKTMVPFINETIILGGFYTPGVGVVDSLQAGTLMRQAAQEMGALTIGAGVEVTGVDTENGRVTRVRTDQGDIDTEVVVIACGIWSPRIAKMAGASIPLTPAVHQMIDIGPVPMFANARTEVDYPIVRDMDTNMYERQHGNGFEVGSYAHRTILMDPDDIPSIEASALSPTMLPFTQDDFDPQLEDALELFPSIVGDESVGVKLAINGLLSLTPDGNPIIGETPEVKNLWSVAAIWIKEAPGIAKCVAEWMTHGTPEIDPHGSDIARFYDHHKTWQHIRARATEGFNKTYGIVHPMEQWESNRPIRRSPAAVRHAELGAVAFEAAGWERPFWYASNEPLLAEYGDRVMPRAAEWDARWWSPIINAEHLAMRDRAGLVDLSAFAIFDVTGPGALAALERLCVNKVDVRPGKTVYTPLLNEAGGILADLTIMRLAHDHFRVVTGGGMGMRDRKIFVDGLPADGSAQLFDLTSAMTTFGLWGPRARDILCGRDGRGCQPRRLPVPHQQDRGHRWRPDARLADQLRRGARLGDLRPDGAGAPGLGCALEGRPAARHGSRRDRHVRGHCAAGEGLSRPRRRTGIGLQPRRGGHGPALGQGRRTSWARRPTRSSGPRRPVAILCTLTVDDPTSSTGVKRYMLGREPILTPDGRSILDAKGRRSYVTSAGSGPSVGKHLLMTYLPPEFATVGTKLVVEYFGEHYPVTVAIAGATPLFDPDNARIRA